MAGITNNLFPPIVSTYQPIFTISSVGASICRVYFSLSAYNLITDVKSLHLTISNQRTNETVLKSKDEYGNLLHPTGIKIYDLKEIKKDTSKTSEQYYVELYDNDIKGGFQINQYYKVQIRFCSQRAIGLTDISRINTWLTRNISFCSEWSTVSIVHGISTPKIGLANFQSTEETDSFVYTQTTLSLIGGLQFEDNTEQELLKKYNAKLYQNNELIASSGDIYPNRYGNLNEINYTFNYLLEDGSSYVLKLEITTNNLYTQTLEYNFMVLQNLLDGELDVDITTLPAEEIGSIFIKITPQNQEPYSGYITFRRTSSKSNFTIWEDVNSVYIDNVPLSYSWYDYTIESGVWYKYCVQKTDEQGQRGIVKIAENPVMVILNDLFFSANKKQLRIKYNPQISAYKRNISESKIDTIGSKYPFIKRNGAMNYKQFSVSGLITIHDDFQDSLALDFINDKINLKVDSSMHLDEGESIDFDKIIYDEKTNKNLFFSKEDLYNSEEILKLYDDYNNINNISEYNDFILEREFREKVMNFLYDDSVKLLRTTAEGNILVRLMDINFSPENGLGRMLYSFSATAYEVDDCTIENLKLYNISGGKITFNLNGESDDIDREPLVEKINKMGQLNQTFKANEEIISNLLTKKYSDIQKTGYIMSVDHLNTMRLEFISNPYLLKPTQTGGLRPLTSLDAPDAETVLGYIVYINGIAIYINPEGVYELSDSETEITSIAFPIETEAIIDYNARIYLTEDLTYVPDTIYYLYKLGQLWGSFSYNESVFHRIWKRYYRNLPAYYSKLISVDGLKIEADPGTVCWIKDSSSGTYRRFVINDTCTLSLYEDDYVIEGFYFGGIHLEQATGTAANRKTPLSNTFIETGISIGSFNEVQNPIQNGVYIYTGNIQEESPYDDDGIRMIADEVYDSTIGQDIEFSNRYIYHNGQWHKFSTNNDILCEVDGLVDYLCEIEKGVHLSA